MRIAFVLVSYRRDAPAGMERSVAALAAGLRQLGHQPFVLTAAAHPGDPATVPLPGVRLDLPADDEDLRSMLHTLPDLEDDLAELYRAHGIDLVCYVDALWGLGARAPQRSSARSTLTVHVVGDGPELPAALARNPHAVTAPSGTVLQQAAARGHDITRWQVVANGLLNPPPEVDGREALRVQGPVRLLARLGPEKGVAECLDALPAGFERPVQVALAAAGFEVDRGSQRRVFVDCRRIAAGRPAIDLCSALAWSRVDRFLAGASVVVVPSSAETFGLVALEAAAAGTPVVAFAVGNLPALLGDAAELVPLANGPDGLWRAVEVLLADPADYEARSTAGRALAPAHAPAVVADAWLAAVTG